MELGSLDSVMSEPGDEELVKSKTDAAPVTPPLPSATHDIGESEVKVLPDPHAKAMDPPLLDLEACFDAVGDHTLPGEDGSQALSTSKPSSSGSSPVVGVSARSLTAKSVAQLVGWRALPRPAESRADDPMEDQPASNLLITTTAKIQRGRGHLRHSGAEPGATVPAKLNAGPYDALVDNEVVEGMGAASPSVYDILEPPIPSLCEGAGVREDAFLHDASAASAVVPVTFSPAVRS